MSRIDGRQWSAEDPRHRWLASYRPRIVTRDVWEGALGEFVRGQVERLDASMSMTQRFALLFTKLGAWCLREGIELQAEAVFDPDTCLRFIEFWDGVAADSSLATYRADLRSVGPLLTKVAPWEPRPKPLHRPHLLPPYSETEERLIRHAVLYQETERRSRSARAVVALGLGAGLDGRWNCKVRATDIDRDARGVVIYVPAPQERVVRVREAFEYDIEELAEHAGDGALTGTASRTKNLPNIIAARTLVDQGRIILNGGRLRSTWLVAHLSAGTHLRVLMEAAGLQKLDALRDLMPHVASISDADAAEQLRWA